MSLALVADLRRRRDAPTAEDLAALETDVLAGFVLARSSAGMTDGTIRSDISHLGTLREWLGKPLWEMSHSDADRYFGSHLKHAAKQTKVGKAAAVAVYFAYLDKRHREELYQLTGRVAECPLDELNRPRGNQATLIRVPPPEAVLQRLFGCWREEMASARKFATQARDYAAARLLSQVGLRINECRLLDLDDIKDASELGRYPKLHVRHGKGSHGSGPKVRIVPLVNGAADLLEWYVQDVRGLFEGERFWSRPAAPLFCSERHAGDGSARRVSDDSLRRGLTEAVARYVPEWDGKITPHVLRHYCASELYRTGMDLIAIQELLGHEWIATTMRYVHVLRSHIEDAWDRAAQRATDRLMGAQQ